MSSKKTIAFRKSNQLCVHCGCKLLGDKYSCESCLLKKRNYRNQRKAKRQQEGKCLECSNSATNVYCVECTKRKRLWVLSNSQHIKNYNKNLYDARKNSGLCVKCGVVSENTRCEICVLKEIASRNLKDVSRWKEIQNIFISQSGTCPYTNRKLIIGVNASLDHVIPKSQGGTNHSSNLQWVDIFVQISKWNKSEQDFLNMVKDIAIHKLNMKENNMFH